MEDYRLPNQDGQVYCLGRNTYGQHADSDSIRFIQWGFGSSCDGDVGIPESKSAEVRTRSFCAKHRFILQTGAHHFVSSWKPENFLVFARSMVILDPRMLHS